MSMFGAWISRVRPLLSAALAFLTGLGTTVLAWQAAYVADNDALAQLIVCFGVAFSVLMFITLSTLHRAQFTERRFRDYAEMATHWLWEHDKDMRFTYLSRVRKDARPFDPRNVLGKTRREIAGDRADAGELDALDRLEKLMLTHVEFTDFEYSQPSRDGGRDYYRLSGRPVFGLNGEFSGYRGVAQMVTAEKRRETELSDAKTAAETASAGKSMFLAMMSHELRTPLNAIIGFSEVVAERRFGPDALDRYCEYARIINHSGQQLLELINDLLDMSKIEAGKLELEEQHVDVAELLGECVKLLRGRAAAADLALLLDIARPAPRLRGDRRALRQVVLNLLSNALKFTPSGGRVRVILDEDADGAVAIRITDNGVGISAEAMQHMFQPFHQADATIARRFGGTGLGLTISRALVEGHGGTLTLESEEGRGTIAKALFPPSRRVPGALPEQQQQPPQRLAAVGD